MLKIKSRASFKMKVNWAANVEIEETLAVAGPIIKTL